MIGIAKKVEAAVISALESQTGMESVEVVRGNAAATHAVFPRVVVACKNIKPLIPGMKSPYQCILELTVQTEGKSDLDGSQCEAIADVVGTALQSPDGASVVDALFGDGKIDKLEFTMTFDLKQDDDCFELMLEAEMYLQA